MPEPPSGVTPGDHITTLGARSTDFNDDGPAETGGAVAVFGEEERVVARQAAWISACAALSSLDGSTTATGTLLAASRGIRSASSAPSPRAAAP